MISTFNKLVYYLHITDGKQMCIRDSRTIEKEGHAMHEVLH